MVLVRVNCQVRGAKSACGRWPLSVRTSLSVLAVSQDTGSHTKLTGNTGPTKEPVLPPSNPAGPFFFLGLTLTRLAATRKHVGLVSWVVAADSQ